MLNVERLLRAQVPRHNSEGLCSDGCPQMGKKRVAPLAGGLQVFGAEGPADAFLRKGRGIDRIVEKPRAVVVPEMMIGILRANAKGRKGRMG